MAIVLAREGTGEVRRPARSMMLSGSSTQWSISRNGSIAGGEEDGKGGSSRGGDWMIRGGNEMEEVWKEEG